MPMLHDRQEVQSCELSDLPEVWQQLSSQRRGQQYPCHEHQPTPHQNTDTDM